MIIGVDASCFGNKRGFGRFTADLFDSLLAIDTKNHYVFFADRETSESGALPAGVDVVVANTKVSPVKAAAASGRRSLPDVWAMTRAVMSSKVDLFFFPAVYSYFPILNRTKILLTIHDMIADNNPKLIFPNDRAKWFWKLKQNLAIKQADVVLTVSENSKREIAGHFGVDPQRIRVISEGARDIFTPKNGSSDRGGVSRLGLTADDTILLYVGGISPHKNLAALIEAFSVVRTRCVGGGLKLVLVGDYKDDPFLSDYPNLKAQVAKLGLGDSVLFTGYVKDGDLVELYQAAAALVFPSIEEGFGLPALEAMSCGTPVIASDTGSLPEVLGDAGRYFDPRNVASMSDAVIEVLSNGRLQSEMRTIGLRRSKDFTWKRAAEDLLSVFEDLDKR